MQFWKTESPDIVITEDLILRSVDHCPLKTVSQTEARLKRDMKVVCGGTDRLWPYTAVSAAVMVLNSAREGPPSAAVHFHTSEDGKLNKVVLCSIHELIPVSWQSAYR